MKTSVKAVEETRSYVVPALEKGLRILEYLCRNPEGKTFSEVSAALGISRTTSFTILRNLTDTGYLRKGPDGNFYASLKVYSLGMEVLMHVNKSELILPDLVSLREKLGYTVHVLVYSNKESIVKEKLDGSSTIVFKSFVGERKPLHLSGGGKAILSYLPVDEFDYYSKGELKRLTKNSLCTREKLVECRQQVRKKGYAIDNEESEQGVFCIGVPLFTVDKGLFGAVSISTLSSVIDNKDRLNECCKHLLYSGESISRKLGYLGEYPAEDL